MAENYKPCIFVVNKWDQLKDSMPTEKWVTYLHDTFRTMRYMPIAFITGKDGRNVRKMLNHAQMLYKQSRERVSTGELNRIVRAALEHQPPPLTKTKWRPKIYYATQIGIEPPTIILKCNEPEAFDNSYRRYLLSFLRDTLSFGEVPIRLILEKRGVSDAKNEVDGDRKSSEV